MPFNLVVCLFGEENLAKMLPTKFAASDRIKICVLVAPPPVQLLDLAAVDAFHMLSSTYLRQIEFLPQPIKDLSVINLDIEYVYDDYNTHNQEVYGSSNDASSPNIRNLAEMTADLKIQAIPLSSASGLNPGQVTILFVPGPDPTSITSKECAAFIQNHAASGSTDVITVCTGIYPACQAGICDGLTVAGPRGLLSDLRNKFKNVTFEEKRWSKSILKRQAETKNVERAKAIGGRPAELWTAAGITNGHDTVAAYIREHFDSELGAIICRICDIGDRQRDYDTGKLAESAWWISTLMTAAIKQLFRR